MVGGFSLCCEFPVEAGAEFNEFNETKRRPLTRPRNRAFSPFVHDLNTQIASNASAHLMLFFRVLHHARYSTSISPRARQNTKKIQLRYPRQKVAWSVVRSAIIMVPQAGISDRTRGVGVEIYTAGYLKRYFRRPKVSRIFLRINAEKTHAVWKSGVCHRGLPRLPKNGEVNFILQHI